MVEQLTNGMGEKYFSAEEFDTLIKQAKAMEKEQIMDAHYAHKYGCFSENYYNETFKKGL